jgi:predicted ABC-type ATPase
MAVQNFYDLPQILQIRKTESRARANWRRLFWRLKLNNDMGHLKTKRQFQTTIEKFNVLGLKTLKEPPVYDPSRGDPPTCILLGGGMGAGKSTVVSILKSDPFFKKYGEGIVLIEADALKMKDPLFTVLNDRAVSTLVHREAVGAAEEMLLVAIQQRRDIIFDGTMTWRPFVEQTIAMLRDNAHQYQRVKDPSNYIDSNGNKIEKYWEITQKLEQPSPPYRLKFIGVTVNAETAVRRGIIRRIVTGRGVPVNAQLRSHQLFSEHFPVYVDLVDDVDLFDNNVQSDKPQEKPQLIAHKRSLDDKLKTRKKPYSEFLNKSQIYPDANCAEEIHMCRFFRCQTVLTEHLRQQLVP